MYLVTAKEMQRMDRATIEKLGIPGRLLMENAGRGATTFFLEAVYRHHPGSVGVMAGRGNNGGDGFVMARYLHQKNIPVTVYLLADPSRIEGDAAANFELLTSVGVPVVEVADESAFAAAKSSMVHRHIWIDAILGTGLNADVRGHLHEAIRFVNRQQRPVFSVDIASGLNADNGQVCGICIKAAATATFGFAKVGQMVYPGKELTGKLKVIEIGIPPALAAQTGCHQHLVTGPFLRRSLPVRSATAHKGGSGHLLILAGSPGKTGAAAMAATAAMRAGAGLVTLGVPVSLHPILETMLSEVMTTGLAETEAATLHADALDDVLTLLENKRCLAAGPGIGTHPATGRLINRLIETSPVPLILDADALNLLALDPSVLKRRQAPIILTPHPGEMARLNGHSASTIQQDRVAATRSFATEFGVHLVLKGAATVLGDPEGSVYINPTGNPGMASGGMGDVLTGLIAGLLTQGMRPKQAALAGIFLHGLAADKIASRHAPIGYLASEVTAAIPPALCAVQNGEHPAVGPDLDPLFQPPGEDAGTNGD